MSDLDPPENKAVEPAENEPSQGPSLVLLYTLVALALILAIACAALIVLPFYRRAQLHPQHQSFLSCPSLAAAHIPSSRGAVEWAGSAIRTGMPSTIG